LWVVVSEWIRAKTTFGFTWAFLGYAAADLEAIRQIASVGGVLLISALIVGANLAIAIVLCARRDRTWWQPLLAVFLALVCATAFGHFYNERSESEKIPVAALQHYQPKYRYEDFAATGLDRTYLPMASSALEKGAKLVVLPESIQLGAVSLDGTRSSFRPNRRQISRVSWEESMKQLLSGLGVSLIVGLDTIESEKDYNSMVAWNASGAAGWYHKRRPVPFAEYWPAGWGSVGARGRMQYSAGDGAQLIRTSGLVIGAFICQEVLFPHISREAARDGATVLVTGGNDGVFANRAVSLFHADAAKLRAVETGRYLIRAMKTGISAIIDPRGNEQQRSSWQRDEILHGTVRPNAQLTFFVRHGNWVLGLSVLLITAGLVWRNLGSSRLH